jgi:hypothetical protein
MLETLLAEIEKGSALEVRSLSARLGVSQHQILLMLESLEQFGKIKRVDLCTQSGCNSCPVGSQCSADRVALQTWITLNN